MKYSFVYNYTGNPFFDSMVYVNTNTSGLLIYMFVLSFFIVLSYVFIKRTDDVPLSLVRSLFATNIISIIVYYMGRSYNLSLFDGSFLITMTLVMVASVGFLYYDRHRVS